MSLLDYTANIRFRNINNNKEYFDAVRRGWYRLFPEELVRQALVRALNEKLGITLERMQCETGIAPLQTRKRTDLIVYDKSLKPFLLAECKSFQHTLKIGDRAQLLNYNSTIQAPMILLSNGVEIYAAIQDDYQFELVESIDQLGHLLTKLGA